MRTSIWFLLVVVSACGSPTADDAEAATDSSSSSGSSDTASLGPGGDDSTAASGSTTDSDDDSTGACEHAECDGEAPMLTWETVSDEIYGDGFCQSVIADGQGGLFASYLGYGFEAYSDVFAVDSRGVIQGRGRGLAAGSYVDLALRGAALFDWAAASGHVGIADASLTNLDGGMLGPDVDRIRAMVRGPNALHYAVRTTPGLECVVRTGADANTDSVPFACAPDFTEERLLIDSLGNRYYFDSLAYRVLRIDPAGALYGSVDGRWNRVGLDAAVDPDGHVWVVGAIGSQPSDVFGGFIARHDFELAADPLFEDASRGSVVWTAVTMTADGPVVFGHEGYGEALHARGLDFDGMLRWSWSQEVLPQTYVDEVTVDADGNLLACGYRYTGEMTPVANDAHHPLFLKFQF